MTCIPSCNETHLELAAGDNGLSPCCRQHQQGLTNDVLCTASQALQHALMLEKQGRLAESDAWAAYARAKLAEAQQQHTALLHWIAQERQIRDLQQQVLALQKQVNKLRDNLPQLQQASAPPPATPDCPAATMSPAAMQPATSAAAAVVPADALAFVRATAAYYQDHVATAAGAAAFVLPPLGAAAAAAAQYDDTEGEPEVTSFWRADMC